jgi:hypothetical protein
MNQQACPTHKDKPGEYKVEIKKDYIWGIYLVCQDCYLDSKEKHE